MRSPISFLMLAALFLMLYFLSEVEAGSTRGPYGNRIAEVSNHLYYQQLRDLEKDWMNCK